MSLSTAPKQDVDRLFEMVESVKLAMLTTIEEDGSLHTRPMSTHEIDSDGAIWFFVENDSTAAENVRVNAQLSLGYSRPDEHHYAAISGVGSVVTDRKLIESKWTESLSAWFPKGKNDPNLALLRVRPVHGELWDSSSPPLLRLADAVEAMLGGSKRPTHTEHRQM